MCEVFNHAPISNKDIGLLGPKQTLMPTLKHYQFYRNTQSCIKTLLSLGVSHLWYHCLPTRTRTLQLMPSRL